MSSALHGLPASQRALTPYLTDATLPEEVRADCASCPLIPPNDPSFFHPEARCCTYQPVLPNHAVGRILNRGGAGARLVRARIDAREGLSPIALTPTDGWRDRYAAMNRRSDFGRDLTLRCPYWRGGDLACGIWEDRDAVCRTWFCQHDAGPRGLTAWHAARDGLRAAERGLARALVARGRAPAADAPTKRWIGWFRWCARHASKLTQADLDAHDRAALDGAKHRFLMALSRRVAPMPDSLAPSVAGVEPLADGVRLTGYLAYAVRDVPHDVFALLSRLDGETPWREALAAAEEELGRALPSDLVTELYSAGMLEERTEGGRYTPGLTVTLKRGDAVTRLAAEGAIPLSE